MLIFCPMCHQPAEEKKYFPFCSLRCSELDMYNWFSNAYTAPAYALEDSEKDEIIRLVEKESDAGTD